jgi:hypothetical protein
VLDREAVIGHDRGVSHVEARVALVTGAGSESGIGFATAAILGARGARVAVAATSGRIQTRRAELEQMGVEAAGFEADLTDPDQAAGLIAAVVERFGRLDMQGWCRPGWTSRRRGSSIRRRPGGSKRSRSI